MASIAPGRPGEGTMLAGIACGAAAGALWGLVFLAPELVGGFGPLQLTVGRYLAYGAIAALLIAPEWKRLRAALTGRDWLVLAWLALMGNVFYYVLLAAAVQNGGIAMTSLVIGFLPVVVTMVGSRDHGAPSLARLAPSLLLCAAGALCIGWQAVAGPGEGSRQVLGLFCAIGSLASWATFAVGNSRALARLDMVSPHGWSLLIGIMTGVEALLLLPAAMLVEPTGHAAGAWLQFAGVSIGVAILASIAGNALWNRMSRLLPLTMVGQMILFETLFALIYGFIWEQRWPRLLEIAAFALVVASVLSCIAAHRERARLEGAGNQQSVAGP